MGHDTMRIGATQPCRNVWMGRMGSFQWSRARFWRRRHAVILPPPVPTGAVQAAPSILYPRRTLSRTTHFAIPMGSSHKVLL